MNPPEHIVLEPLGDRGSQARCQHCGGTERYGLPCSPLPGWRQVSSPNFIKAHADCEPGARSVVFMERNAVTRRCGWRCRAYTAACCCAVWLGLWVLFATTGGTAGEGALCASLIAGLFSVNFWLEDCPWC